MFPISDPGTTLDLHRQRVAEMIREAEDYKRARSVDNGRHRRFGRWRRSDSRSSDSRGSDSRGSDSRGSEPCGQGGKVTTATA